MANIWKSFFPRTRGRPDVQSPPAQKPAGHPRVAYREQAPVAGLRRWDAGGGWCEARDYVNGRPPAWGLPGKAHRRD